MEAGNIIVTVGVIGLRLLVPLLIPRFPLPALIACLIIDAADQTIFQKFSTVNLESYQSYDKALDIYYLSIAYLSTYRNWTNRAAFKISQFLFYFRMIGIALFQLSGINAFLFIFPNTFEYFFIFYTVVGLRWNPKKLSTKFLIFVALFIWIFIKLPQEYWLHIAGLDMTDFIKLNIFNVPVDTPFDQLFILFPWLLPLVIGVTALIVVLAWFILKKLPPPDLRFTFASRTPNKIFSPILDLSFMNLIKLKRNDFIEKIFLSGLMTIIFSTVFPSFQRYIHSANIWSNHYCLNKCGLFLLTYSFIKI